MSDVRLENVVKKYTNGFTALQNFNLDIADKEFIVFVGPTGSGKSSILRMIAGLECMTEGGLYIGYKRMNDIAPQDRGVAMIFQNSALYPHMTVYDNVAFGLKRYKTSESETAKRIHEAAETMDIAHLLNLRPKSLSESQRQRVAVARAIAKAPEVFLMDEPLLNLETKLRAQMRVEIVKLHRRLQATFIYATRDQAEAMALGTRIVVLRDGVIQQADTPQNIYLYPSNLFVAGFIGLPQMNLFEATAVQEGGHVYAAFGSSKLKLGGPKADAVMKGGYIGKTVMVGIRPEDMHDEAAFKASTPDTVLDMDVEVVEMLGAEAFLYLKLEAQTMTARVGAHTSARPGDKIKITIDVDKIHIFDLETELAITN